MAPDPCWEHPAPRDMRARERCAPDPSRQPKEPNLRAASAVLFPGPARHVRWLEHSGEGRPLDMDGVSRRRVSGGPGARSRGRPRAIASSPPVAAGSPCCALADLGLVEVPLASDAATCARACPRASSGPHCNPTLVGRPAIAGGSRSVPA